MTKKSDHVHKLRRHRHKSGNIVFFCALPDCNYKVSPSLSLGKRSLCWRCDQPFLMNEYTLRLAKPHCENCHKPKSDNSSEAKEDSLTSVALPSVLKEESLSERLERILHSVSDTPSNQGLTPPISEINDEEGEI